MRAADVLPFAIGGVTFTCWAADDGCYVWLSGCKRISAGRTGRVFWASVDGRRIGGEHVNLRNAMVAGANALMSRRAA